MNAEERERLYREAMRARRQGETCPLCGHHHSAATPCASDLPLARNSDVETSHAAATHNPQLKATQRLDVLRLHSRHPAGLTDDEVSVLAGDDLWRRCSDLRGIGLIDWLYEDQPSAVVAGLIKPRPVTRKARSGRQGRVSVITQAGRGELGLVVADAARDAPQHADEANERQRDNHDDDREGRADEGERNHAIDPRRGAR